MWRTAKLAVVQIGVTLLVIYFLMEGWARLFPPKDQLAWPLVQNPTVGTTFIPNARVVHSNGLDFHVEERSNEAGFLDRPLPPVERTLGACRIALIGDSFIEAAQVPISQKVQVELQKQLEAKGTSRVETMAFGFSGTGQLNQLGYLEAFVRPRRPDIIALVFVSNDFANNSSVIEAIRVGWHPDHAPRLFAREKNGKMEVQPIDQDWARHRLPATEDERPWLHRTLHRASRFYRWVYAKLTLQYPALAQRMGNEPTYASRTNSRIAALAKVAPEQARLLDGWEGDKNPLVDVVFDRLGELPPAFEQAIRFTGFAFDIYRERAAADGAKLIVLGTHELSDVQEARVKALLDARGITYLSMKAHINTLGRPIKDANWRHDGHWNHQGHIWAAETLAGEIARQKLCEGR